jgi:hypothetical protein
MADTGQPRPQCAAGPPSLSRWPPAGRCWTLADAWRLPFGSVAYEAEPTPHGIGAPRPATLNVAASTAILSMR